MVISPCRVSHTSSGFRLLHLGTVAKARRPCAGVNLRAESCLSSNLLYGELCEISSTRVYIARALSTVGISSSRRTEHEQAHGI